MKKKLLDIDITGKITTKLKKELTEIFSIVNSKDLNLAIIFSVKALDKKLPEWLAKCLKNKNCLVLEAKELKNNNFTKWIDLRAKELSLNIAVDGLHLLSNLTKGNLLEADQSLQRLVLSNFDNTITQQDILAINEDKAMFEVFALSNSILQGDWKKAIRQFNQLKLAATELVLIFWVVSRDVSDLFALKQLSASKCSYNSIQTLINKRKIFPSRKQLLQQALLRLSLDNIEALLANLLNIDLQIKGLKSGNAWLSLKILIEQICVPRLIEKTVHQNLTPNAILQKF